MGNICRKDDTGGGPSPDAGGPAPPPPDGGGPTPNPDLQPPQVTITSPTQNAQVQSSLKVVINATDDIGVVKVDLKIDGTLAASKNSAPYEFSIVLQPGTHQLTAEAYDKTNKKGQASVTVTVPGGNPGPPPAPDSGPGPGPAPGPTPGGSGVFGSVCAKASDCTSGMCVFDSAFNTHYCTQACGVADSCPFVSAECMSSADGTKLCALKAPEQNQQNPEEPAASGCSLSEAAPAAATGLAGLGLLTVLLLGLVVRRRA